MAPYLWLATWALTTATACGSDSPSVHLHENRVPIKKESPEAAPAKAQHITVRQGDVVKSVQMETKPIEDGCQMDVAQRILRTRKDRVTTCARQAAGRLGHIPAGRIVISLVLDKQGHASKRIVSLNETGDSDLGKCIVEMLDLTFPNPYGKTCIIQAPYRFADLQNEPH